MDDANISRTTRLVWLLAGAGLATGAVTLAIVGSALWVVMSAHRRHESIDDRLGQIVESSHEACEQAQLELNRLLGDDPLRSESPTWLPSPAELAAREQLARDLPALAHSLARTGASVESLRQLDTECRAWAAERDDVDARLRAVRQRVETALYLCGGGEAPSPSAADADQLRQALHQMHDARSAADLESIRTQKLLPAVAALRRGLLSRSKSNITAGDPRQHFGQLVESIFDAPWPGNGAHGPTPGPAGLVTLLAKHLEIAQRREDLKQRVSAAISAMHEAAHDLRSAQVSVGAQQADAIRSVFQQAWRAVLLAGTMAIGFFLVTCWKLPRVLGSQLAAIRRNVAELESARQRLKLQNVALEQAQKRAELASQGKSEFLAMVGHEFRTPLTAVLGFADVLLESPLPAGLREAAEAIDRNGRHLLSVVNDLGDLSRIEARKLDVRRAPCSLIETLRETVSLVAARGKSRGVTPQLQFATPFPSLASTDPTRLRQIVLDLAACAVDLTEEGPVVITAACSHDQGGTSDGVARLYIELLAPGVGLSDSQFARLFEPFSQPLAASGQGQGDIGLGLSISRRLAHLLGGELHAGTELGYGTRFMLSLPIEIAADASWENLAEPGSTPISGSSRRPVVGQRPLPAAFESPSPLLTPGLRILVAEDGPDNQRLIARVLKRIGAEIEIVSNGAQAADLALRNWRTGSPYSVILMDMQMPVLDGYSATRKLRDAGYDGPIIALTAHAMSHDRQRCLDAGCSDYATKPLEIATLQLMIRKYASGPEAVSR